MGNNVFVVIPNWNGAHDLPTAIDAVLAQSHKDLTLVIVDNGSVDDSHKIIEAYKQKDARVASIYRDKNYGFTGGMNPGLERAIVENATYVAGCNNDAKPHPDWLKHLVQFLNKNPDYGVAACSLLDMTGKHYDSTGDLYTTWGLPFPRGRDEPVRGQYDRKVAVFGASGGASLYRTSVLEKVGLFDQDFFAYYEDIDLSFRIQLAGWKIGFVPQSHVFHDHGSTSRTMKGFTTLQTIKNYPWIIVKNVPARLLPRIVPRFLLAYTLFFWRAVSRGHGGAAVHGLAKSIWLLPKKCLERRVIQKNRRVNTEYIWGIITHDLPPNAHKLRTLRRTWWRVRGKNGATT